jgi:hypothetical protein
MSTTVYRNVMDSFYEMLWTVKTAMKCESNISSKILFTTNFLQFLPHFGANMTLARVEVILLLGIGRGIGFDA